MFEDYRAPNVTDEDCLKAINLRLAHLLATPDNLTPISVEIRMYQKMRDVYAKRTNRRLPAIHGV